MKRRKALAVIGSTAIAGCLSSERSNRSPTDEPGTPTSFSAPNRTVSLVEVDEKPREYNIDLSVEVDRPTITNDHTARVVLSFRNASDLESPQLGLDNLYALSPVTTEYELSEPDAIVLYGTDIPWRQPTRSAGCWETRNAGGPGDGGSGEPPITLESGASLSRTYRVWDALPETACLPAGEYRYGFETDGTTDKPPFGWMFTLAVESGR